MDREEYILTVVQAGVLGSLTVAISILAILTFVRVRKHADPARCAFTWLKVALVLAFLSQGLTFASYLVWIARVFVPWVLDDDYGYDWEENRLHRAEYGLGSAGWFLETLAQCALVVTFAELGNGFLYALTRQLTPKQITVRRVAIASIVPLAILAIVDLGWDGAVYKEYFDIMSPDYNLSFYDEAMEDVGKKMANVANVRLAWMALHCAIMVALVVQAAMVKHKYQGIQPADQGVTIYLVAPILNLVRALWILTRFSAITYGEVWRLTEMETNFGLTLVFNICIFFIVLVLLSVVGSLRHRGLWTIGQPWMARQPQMGQRGLV
ncbi:hypothetical protein ACO1O0_007236 [Amphichorda felina]